MPRLKTSGTLTGALVTGEAHTVTTDEDENVVLVPTDPEDVYIPQYDPEVVHNNSISDAILTDAAAFGIFAVIDAIFHDDDD